MGHADHRRADCVPAWAAFRQAQQLRRFRRFAPSGSARKKRPGFRFRRAPSENDDGLRACVYRDGRISEHGSGGSERGWGGEGLASRS